MSSVEFYDAVKTGGDWDYKQGSMGKYEDFGNYHFGIVGAANGWSKPALLSGAGAYQIYSDLLKYGNKNSPGWPLVNSPYGDQIDDQKWIREGIQDYYNIYEQEKGASGSWACGVSGSW